MGLGSFFSDALADLGAGLRYGGEMGRIYRDIAEYEGISTSEAKKLFTQQMLEAERLKQEKIAQDLRNANDRAQLENEEKIRKLEERDAEIFALSGLRRGEVQPETVTFYSPDDKNLTRGIQMAPPTEGPLAPGLYLRHEERTPEEKYAEIKQQLAEEELARNMTKEDLIRKESERELDLRAEELDLSERKEKRYQAFTAKNMEILDARLEELRNKGVNKLSDAQAMQLAYSMLEDEIDIEDPTTASRVSALARYLKRMYEDPYTHAEASEIGKKAIENSVEAFEDDKFSGEASTGLEGRIGEAARELGEEDMTPENIVKPEDVTPEESPILQLPVVDGKPYAAAMDPNISFMDLIGANKKAQTYINENELSADQQKFEWQARHLQSLGVPFDEWPEELKAFVEALRSPNTGLQQQ